MTGGTTIQADDAKDIQTTANGCTIERFAIHSPTMNRRVDVAVLLPPAYTAESERRFPVLYALPGGDAAFDVWTQMSPLQCRLNSQPMIIVGFDGNPRTWYLDATHKPDSQMQTFFFDELTPYIKSHYRTDGREAITGFSMGGFGAFHYMLIEPARFTAISALSGAFAHLGDDDHPAHESLADLLGPYDENIMEYRKWRLDHRIRAAVENHVKLPPMVVHCGTEDRLLEDNRRFRDLLLDLNKKIVDQITPDEAIEDPRQQRQDVNARRATAQIPFEYRESPGGHVWPFWRDASAGLADFHWHAFQADQRKP